MSVFTVANCQPVRIAAPNGPITAAQTGQFPSVSMPSGSCSVSYTTVSSSPQPVTATPDPVGLPSTFLLPILCFIHTFNTFLPEKYRVCTACRNAGHFEKTEVPFFQTWQNGTVKVFENFGISA